MLSVHDPPPPAGVDFAAGQVLPFDKPREWTSFDVVNKVRKLVNVKKVGHAGTLDPLAMGLLILCTGRKTKSIPGIQDAEKEYIVRFRLGATTQSYDAEFPPENEQPVAHLRREDVEAALPNFRGNIRQVPPAYSAVKVKGKRAYELARRGKPVELGLREVTVDAFELQAFEPPAEGVARIVCSKGTYIRSLVHDMGQALGVGAYVLELRRTRIGACRIGDAWTIPAFEDWLRGANSPPL